MITGVAKYIKKNEKQHVSGVSRYVLRQSIAEKNQLIPTGVSKYLQKASQGQDSTKKTTVDKYLLRQEWAEKNQPALTGVARYQAEQNLLERKKAAAELVKKYREAEEKDLMEAKIAAVVDYEKNCVSNLDMSQEESNPAQTGVGRYLQSNSSGEAKKSTTVAKYIARQIIIDSQKPKLSKVAKFIQEQSISEAKKPKPTGVAKYLASLHSVGKSINKPKSVVKESSVSKYISTQEALEKNKPVLSGVARYLQSKVDAAGTPKLIGHETVEKCLEGEFIPANEEIEIRSTSVSRYIENKDKVVSLSVEAPSDASSVNQLTGVARYLEKQSVKQADISRPLSGVDRYLLRKAS